ncbi:DNA replication licensing factor MCM2, putative [Perkinsus marinus ATCC 50983]|uniref:DNA replication licensing factor MCM2, putative n=1 Tax=Perkinsus marinus (strain ATCC 50983 / TXsc) TaxID=423536 RepID=C5KFN3_PERM5|nr:DNA replication licensing factor MCM2, putative [Perkinsus marinus ATCC 50983]EER16710.1 DNA replication licensing factor MCM2, putative [Perkinsus marinus ATCC 50983]|eukprot:XP_002784914.1 DNA replication licensing factor MCM2, putative [Perkinsus marinus ATCC 50983]
MSHRDRFFPTRDEPEDDDEVDAGSEAMEDDRISDGVDDAIEEEDEGEGEDLMDNMEEDYRPMPELDRYDPRMLDEQEYGDDAGARRRAERELRERDRGQRRRMPGAVFGGDSSDSEDDDDRMGAYERKRRRLERLRRAAQAEDDDAAMDEEIDADLIDLNNEEVGPDTDLSPDSRLGKKIIANFSKFLQTFIDPTEDAYEPYYSEKIHHMCAEGKTSFTVSFHPHLADWSPFMAQWLCDRPHHILKLLLVSATEFTKKKYKELFANDRHREINVRIVSFPVVDLIRNLRAFHINKLVNVVGVVTRRSVLLPKLRVLYLTCMNCQFLCGPFDLSASEESGTSFKPGHCPECQNTGPYAVNREETVYKNHQVITLQEAPGSVLPGRMPRSVEVILSDDLVDSVRPGDQCSIVGTYHARYDSAGNVRAGFPVFKCAIDANSIVRQNEMKIESVRDEDKRDEDSFGYGPLWWKEKVAQDYNDNLASQLEEAEGLYKDLFEKVQQMKEKIGVTDGTESSN